MKKHMNKNLFVGRYYQKRCPLCAHTFVSNSHASVYCTSCSRQMHHRTSSFITRKAAV